MTPRGAHDFRRGPDVQWQRQRRDELAWRTLVVKERPERNHWKWE